MNSENELVPEYVEMPQPTISFGSAYAEVRGLDGVETKVPQLNMIITSGIVRVSICLPIETAANILELGIQAVTKIQKGETVPHSETIQ